MSVASSSDMSSLTLTTSSAYVSAGFSVAATGCSAVTGCSAATGCSAGADEAACCATYSTTRSYLTSIAAAETWLYSSGICTVAVTTFVSWTRDSLTTSFFSSASASGCSIFCSLASCVAAVSAVDAKADNSRSLPFSSQSTSSIWQIWSSVIYYGRSAATSSKLSGTFSSRVFSLWTAAKFL